MADISQQLRHIETGRSEAREGTRLMLAAERHRALAAEGLQVLLDALGGLSLEAVNDAAGALERNTNGARTRFEQADNEILEIGSTHQHTREAHGHAVSAANGCNSGQMHSVSSYATAMQGDIARASQLMGELVETLTAARDWAVIMQHGSEQVIEHGARVQNELSAYQHVIQG